MISPTMKFSVILTKLLQICCFSFTVLFFQNCKKEEIDQSPLPQEEINKLPFIEFVHPGDSASFIEDTIIEFKFNVLDEDGTVAKIELFLNDTLKEASFEQPWKIDWTTNHDNIGKHKVSAIAYDNDNGTSEDVITISVVDYRSFYWGEFDFEVKRTHYDGDGNVSGDTSIVQGNIKAYQFSDSESDFTYRYDDPDADPNQKITIEFGYHWKIIPILSRNGVFNNHYPGVADLRYRHQGEFINYDTVIFETAWGSLGGMSYFDVKGIKK
jgi:hypothetical protein